MNCRLFSTALTVLTLLLLLSWLCAGDVFDVLGHKAELGEVRPGLCSCSVLIQCRALARQPRVREGGRCSLVRKWRPPGELGVFRSWEQKGERGVRSRQGLGLCPGRGGSSGVGTPPPGCSLATHPLRSHRSRGQSLSTSPSTLWLTRSSYFGTPPS